MTGAPEDAPRATHTLPSMVPGMTTTPATERPATPVWARRALVGMMGLLGLLVFLLVAGALTLMVVELWASVWEAL